MFLLLIGEKKRDNNIKPQACQAHGRYFIMLWPLESEQGRFILTMLGQNRDMLIP